MLKPKSGELKLKVWLKFMMLISQGDPGPRGLSGKHGHFGPGGNTGARGAKGQKGLRGHTVSNRDGCFDCK